MKQKPQPDPFGDHGRGDVTAVMVKFRGLFRGQQHPLWGVGSPNTAVTSELDNEPLSFGIRAGSNRSERGWDSRPTKKKMFLNYCLIFHLIK